MTLQDNDRSQRITILGCGSMGTALLKGWLRDKNSNLLFTAYTRSEASTERLKSALGDDGHHIDDDNLHFFSGDGLKNAVDEADVVLLGIPPNDLTSVLQVDSVASTLAPKLIISMLAGVSLIQIRQTIRDSIKSTEHFEDAQVVRIIPTIGATIGESVTMLAHDQAATAPTNQEEHVDALFSRLGSINRVPEPLMNDATALGAAMHALAATAVDAATDASVASGMPRSVALALAASSLRGAADLMSAGQMTPESVKAAMSTPGGITINAFVDLHGDVRPGIATTVRSAINYARGMNN